MPCACSSSRSARRWVRRRAPIITERRHAHKSQHRICSRAAPMTAGTTPRRISQPGSLKAVQVAGSSPEAEVEERANQMTRGCSSSTVLGFVHQITRLLVPSHFVLFLDEQSWEVVFEQLLTVPVLGTAPERPPPAVPTWSSASRQRSETRRPPWPAARRSGGNRHNWGISCVPIRTT